MEEMTTLEEWLNAMTEHNQSHRISIKTALLMNDILNGKLEKNMVVFDNAGDMPFTIWDFATEADARGFMGSLNEGLVFGYVISGKSTLCEYQIKYPHWLLPRQNQIL